MKVTSTSLALSALFDVAFAFPSHGLEALARGEAAARSVKLSPRSPKASDVPTVPFGFDPKAQYVSTSGQYAFVAPGPTDARGPCPGLNAMANHGYLPHNGVATISQFIEGTLAVFGMGEDLSGFLAVYGAIFDGDLTAWSIGGPSASLPIISGLLGTPQGISGSHNKYENDASPIRGDLYLVGNDYKSQISAFTEFYNRQKGVADGDVNYGLDVITDHRKSRFDHSIAKNPYFFNGPFSGAIASPAAYSFIYRFMANKSAEYPEGRLDRNVLKTFYAITGEPGSFKYTPGHERIPENWYTRAAGDEYTIPYFAADTIVQVAKHPEFISIGGNLGKVNSFVGLDPSNLTGGVYNLGQLTTNKHAFLCFGFELLEEAAPDLLEGIFTDITPAMTKMKSMIANATVGFTCPQIEKKQYNQFKQYQKYPGYSKAYNGYPGL